MFKVGQWVSDKSNKTGYVTALSSRENMIYVTFPCINRTYMKDTDELYFLPIEKESDPFLIDLALELKDFEWLKELTQKERVK